MKRALCALILALALAGCGTPSASTPPPVQNSPQTTVALTIKTIADADQAGVKTVISLRDSGKLSQANTTTIENWLGFVADTDKRISAILATNETWAMQKQAILLQLRAVVAPTFATLIDPGAQAVIAQVMTAINLLITQVQA